MILERTQLYSLYTPYSIHFRMVVHMYIYMYIYIIPHICVCIYIYTHIYIITLYHTIKDTSVAYIYLQLGPRGQSRVCLEATAT